MNNRLLKILKYLLGWPFSILAFFFILRLILPKIPSFSTNLESLNIPVLLCGVFFFLLFYAVRAYIWHRLLKTYHSSITYKQAAHIWSLSEVRRYIPGNFWALLGRTVLFSEIGVKKQDTGKLVAIEIVIFVIGAATVSLLALPFVSSFFPLLTPFLQTITFVVVLTVWILYTFNNKFIRFFPKSNLPV